MNGGSVYTKQTTFELSEPAALSLAPMGDLNHATKEEMVIRAFETSKI